MQVLFCVLIVWFIALCTVSFCYSFLIRPVMIQRVAYNLYKFRDENRQNRIDNQISDSDYWMVEERVNVAFQIIDIIDAGLLLTFDRSLKATGELARLQQEELKQSEYVRQMKQKLAFITIEATIYNSQFLGLVYIVLRKTKKMRAWANKKRLVRDMITKNQNVTNSAPLASVHELRKKLGLPANQYC